MKNIDSFINTMVTWYQSLPVEQLFVLLIGFNSMVSLLTLIITVINLTVTVTQHPYRAGHRVYSIREQQTRGDPLLQKIKTQSEWVSGGYKYNLDSPFWLTKNCHFTVQDHVRIMACARHAEALGELGPPLGYKIGSNGKLCRVSIENKNVTITASGNLFSLVFVY